MRDLSVRALEEEQMDDAALTPAEYESVLADLGRVNRWTFAARPTLDFLRRGTRGTKTFSLLDVGFGEGGMLRDIARWANARGLEARLTGVDLNPK
ncbi:MAG TPA: methyltransferase type 12, partial [Allosphingosinicella sp.]